MITAYRGVRAAVFGVSGFIGQWIARRLNDAGAETFFIVRNPSECRLPGEILEADLRNPEIVESLFARVRPSITFNLAGYGVDPSERDETLSQVINADAVERICLSAARWSDRTWPGQSLVHTGSALEYGDVGGHLNEDGPTRPTNVYGQTKLRGTQIVSRLSGQLGLRALTARLFTVFGPGEHAGRLLPCLIDASRQGQPVPLSAGTQRRDFTYVEDVVEGLLRLGLANAGPGAIVNLATGSLNTVRHFAETAARVLGMPESQLKFGSIPTRPEEMAHLSVSIRNLKALTGFVPSTTIEEGVRRTVLRARGEIARA